MLIVSEPEQPDQIGWRRELWPEEYEDEGCAGTQKAKDHEGRRGEAVVVAVHGEGGDEKRGACIRGAEFPGYGSCPPEEARDQEEDDGETLGLEPRGTTRKRDN